MKVEFIERYLKILAGVSEMPDLFDQANTYSCPKTGKGMYTTNDAMAKSMWPRITSEGSIVYKNVGYDTIYGYCAKLRMELMTLGALYMVPGACKPILFRLARTNIQSNSSLSIGIRTPTINGGDVVYVDYKKLAKKLYAMIHGKGRPTNKSLKNEKIWPKDPRRDFCKLRDRYVKKLSELDGYVNTKYMESEIRLDDFGRRIPDVLLHKWCNAIVNKLHLENKLSFDATDDTICHLIGKKRFKLKRKEKEKMVYSLRPERKTRTQIKDLEIYVKNGELVVENAERVRTPINDDSNVIVYVHDFDGAMYTMEKDECGKITLSINPRGGKGGDLE